MMKRVLGCSLLACAAIACIWTVVMMAYCRPQADYERNQVVVRRLRVGSSRKNVDAALRSGFVKVEDRGGAVSYVSFHCSTGLCSHVPVMVDEVDLIFDGDRLVKIEDHDIVGWPCIAYPVR